MKQALFKNQLVTPNQFVTLAPHWKQTGEHPQCYICGIETHLYGVHSTNVRSRFDHVDGVSTCPLSNSADQRYLDLRPADIDLEQAKFLKYVFLNTAYYQQAFEFCRYMVGKGFNKARLEELIKQADDLKIWSYKGLPLWVIPYILLTLDNFKIHNEHNHFNVTFKFEKPSTSNPGDLWLKPHECRLLKTFTDSGTPCLYPADNPYPLSDLFMWAAGNYKPGKANQN